MKLTQEQKDWWNTLDMDDKFLSKVFCSTYGSVEQVIAQLFIVRENLNFKKK